jgi:predicted DNA binding protein
MKQDKKLLGIWRSMRNRCYNVNQKAYKYYGGRGIVVSERWLGTDGFDNFVADMGARKDRDTLERVDVNGNYEPANCKWATQQEQANNKRNSRYITANGETKTLAQWSKILQCSPAAILLRIKNGMPEDEAVTKAIPERPNSKLTLEQAKYARSQYPMRTMQDIAKELGVCKKTVLNIIHNRIFKE